MTQTQLNKKYKQLEVLETKCQDLADNANRNNRWKEVMLNDYSHLNLARNRWEKLIIELRGIEGYRRIAKPNQHWIDYCAKRGCVVDYTFDDLLA
jgi:hypothetical protein